MRTLRHTSFTTAIALPVLLMMGATVSLTAEDTATSDTATYEVVFVPSWNPASHPVEYPLMHAAHGLLTPVIGATHGTGYRLFGDGLTPTPGLESLSETGMHTPLDDEIRQAIADGTASTLIEFDEGSPGPVHPAVQQRIQVTRGHPLVSLVGMIAPSPDWFYGASSVELFRDGRWVPSLHADAYAWDSGGDGGTTYMAEDEDLEPKQPTMRADTRHFFPGGVRTPVGVFIFKRVPTEG